MVKASLDILEDLSGVPKVRIEELLAILKAPDSFSQMLLVMRNLKNALNAVGEIKYLYGDLCAGSTENGEGGLFRYLVEINQIVSALDACKPGQCPDVWLEQSGRRHGIINDHPEWAMLILTSDAKCFDSEAYWQHVGVVVACSAIQRQRHKKRIGSEITAACRDIRSIASGKKSLELLSEMCGDTTLESYRRDHLLEGKEVCEPLPGIELLVRKVLSQKGKTRDGGGGGGGQTSRIIERHVVNADSDDDEHEGPECSTHLSESVGDGKTQNRQRTAGLHPRETQTLRAVAITESKISPTSGFDPRDAIRRQKQQIKHISQANQRLPYRYSYLSQAELAWVTKETFQLIYGHGSFEQRDDVDTYAGVLLMLMTWLGRPVQQLLGMRVYATRHDLPKQRKDILAFLTDENAFVLPIPSPQWRNSLQDDAKKLLYVAGESSPSLVDEVIIVASPVRIKQAIAQLFLTRKSRTRYREMFPEYRRRDIEKAMQAAVSKMNRIRRMRLTPLRISQVLFDEISRYSQDWVDAYLITGHRFTIAEVAAHYYSVSSGYLEGLYYKSVVSVRDGLYRYLDVDEKDFYSFNQEIKNEGDHGSKLNVKLALLTRLVQHLKNELRASRRLPPEEESWRQVHNHFVAYIAFWVLFATGYRAVNDLVFRWREIDFTTGFLAISDKDDEAMSQSRVVWLLPELREQLRQYAGHLEVLQSRLYQRAALYEHIEAVLSDPMSDVPLMFFISDSWQLVQLTPENLRHQVPVFTLPINTSRHYLRTALRHEGVPGELVNAFMGHAQQGQEPFGAFSTLTPVELFGKLAPVLDTLRKQAGWAVQKGLANV